MRWSMSCLFCNTAKTCWIWWINSRIPYKWCNEVLCSTLLVPYRWKRLRRISRRVLPTGTDFGPIQQLFNFRGGASRCGHLPKFIGVETLIFGFLPNFYLLVPIFGSIQQLFILVSFSHGRSSQGKTFWVNETLTIAQCCDSSANWTDYPISLTWLGLTRGTG